MLIFMLIVAVGLGVWLIFSPAPRWLLWLLPVFVAVPWAVGYMRDRGEINAQPGLLIVGGFLSVLAYAPRFSSRARSDAAAS